MSLNVFKKGKPRQEPGTWNHLAGTASVSCPDCGTTGNLSGHAITITDGTNILLNGSANFVMAAGDTLTLTMYNDQVWVEDARQVN